MFFNKKQDLPKTILVVDDDPTSLQMLVQVVSTAGYNAIGAESGEKGLKLAREINPDVLIIDVVMPGMDGFMLLKELKNDDLTRNIPVLVISARQNVADTLRRLGAVNFLNKPVDTAQLLIQIQKLLAA